MSDIASCDLNEKDVRSLLLALNGDVIKNIEWCSTLTKWLDVRDLKLKILALTQVWLREYSLAHGCHVGRHDWDTDEGNLQDWVYYQMEFMGGLVWDGTVKEVVVNKYASSRPLFSEEVISELLKFLTLEIRKEYCI